MTEILDKLAEKNYWCRKFVATNEAFLSCLKHAPDIALEELDFFYNNRESLLKIIESVDSKIQDCLDRQIPGVAEPNFALKTTEIIQEKNQLVQKILLLDEEIISLLEIEKIKQGERLSALNKGKKALAKYHSGRNYMDKINKRV